MALEKRNVEATLESTKYELAELEAAMAVLKNNKETQPLSQSPREMVSPTETHIALQSESEIAMLKLKITEMVQTLYRYNYILIFLLVSLLKGY